MFKGVCDDTEEGLTTFDLTFSVAINAYFRSWVKCLYFILHILKVICV